jgi:hypothetical protein
VIYGSFTVEQAKIACIQEIYMSSGVGSPFLGLPILFFDLINLRGAIVWKKQY